MLLAAAQMAFILLMAAVLLLFLFAFALSWARHQDVRPEASLVDVVSVAAVEWGAWMTLALFMLRPIRTFFDAPPARERPLHPHQIPIVFIPSLHTNGRIFNSLQWRLLKHHCTSLWIFSWRAALSEPLLLEIQIVHFFQQILAQTQSKKLHVVSFGSSRPLVSRALAHPDFKDISIHWICVSGSQRLSKTQSFLHTRRLMKTYALPFTREPELTIVGADDFFQYPFSLFGTSPTRVLEGLGHYASLLHSDTTHIILESFNLHGTLAFRHG